MKSDLLNCMPLGRGRSVLLRQSNQKCAFMTPESHSSFVSESQNVKELEPRSNFLRQTLFVNEPPRFSHFDGRKKTKPRINTEDADKMFKIYPCNLRSSAAD